MTGLIQRLVNAALSGEMSAHLKEERALGAENRRNGHTSKKLDTELGPVAISPPRDRGGRFEPQLVGKWSRQLGTGLDRQILMLYAHGNSYGDIQLQLRELYGLDYSTASISEVTEQVWGEVSAWQQRALEPFYAAVFLDGIYFTTREGGKSVKKVVYSVYGVGAEGGRDVLGIYIREAEGAREWGRVLEDLRRRGVEDVLFFCVDGLEGFSEAIGEVFPHAFVQRCIVHMIRSSTRFVSDKDIKAVCADLRSVYAAADEAQAQVGLAAFRQKWDNKYPEIAQAWEQNWGELMLFMDFGENIRRMIYTTNAVEALHRQIRKVTKSKGSWVNDKALLKQLYLILTYGRGGWKRTVFNWTAISRELCKHFGQRYSQHLE
ncbi:MAG: IS256 family transposase [Saprospirales bacterium]|nr:IS256 family transposase [Saprospirales bacterium]